MSAAGISDNADMINQIFAKNNMYKSMNFSSNFKKKNNENQSNKNNENKSNGSNSTNSQTPKSKKKKNEYKEPV